MTWARSFYKLTNSSREIWAILLSPWLRDKLQKHLKERLLQSHSELASNGMRHSRWLPTCKLESQTQQRLTGGHKSSSKPWLVSCWTLQRVQRSRRSWMTTVTLTSCSPCRHNTWGRAPSWHVNSPTKINFWVKSSVYFYRMQNLVVFERWSPRD